MAYVDQAKTDPWRNPPPVDLCDEYDSYLTCANDGKGGDITNNGAPLKSLQEWLEP